LSSSYSETNEIVQETYKTLSLYPAFWTVGTPAVLTPYFFKVTGSL